MVASKDASISNNIKTVITIQIGDDNTVEPLLAATPEEQPTSL